MRIASRETLESSTNTRKRYCEAALRRISEEKSDRSWMADSALKRLEHMSKGDSLAWAYLERDYRIYKENLND